MESVSKDGAENYILKDKSKYNEFDSSLNLKRRLQDHQKNKNLSFKWKTRMLRLIEYKLRNINSDGYYCQGVLV